MSSTPYKQSVYCINAAYIGQTHLEVESESFEIKSLAYSFKETPELSIYQDEFCPWVLVACIC